MSPTKTVQVKEQTLSNTDQRYKSIGTDNLTIERTIIQHTEQWVKAQLESNDCSHVIQSMIELY